MQKGGDGMSWGYGNLGGGNGNKSSTLPPPVTGVSAVGTDRTVTVSFEPVAAEYTQYLGDPAYIVVIKAGSVPESPTDGASVKLDAKGAVVE